MAVKWAVVNGAWSAGATWNDGVVPTTDDVVYLDGHNITIQNTTCNCKELRNDLNPNTNLSGGNLTSPTGNNFYLNGDIFSEFVILNLSNSGMNSVFHINGNINILGSGKFCQTSSNGIANSVINGNINAPIATTILTAANPANGIGLTINGNVNAPLAVFCNVSTTANSYNITINGNLTIDNLTATTLSPNQLKFTVSGILEINAQTIKETFVSVYANKIHYANAFPFLLSRVFALDSSLFECKYIGVSPNPNPYIIVNPNTIAQTYPQETQVLNGVVYGAQMELEGTYTPDYPPESVVMQGVAYAFGEMTGTMDVSVQVGCVTKEDVRDGVPLLGMGETGTLVVPSADDVREGVVFDNGTIGTLIVQGGGDRLRIADFGYYTNAQSDTYIVDITEADKPKFASAEERILIEMFPNLDLDNIPEMYFDDLFVKYLKYRLIVEYYRTAGVNSTFTPSEPTTEIVNYRNVTCEVWLNSANIYLNAWNKKYDLNKPPQKIRL